VHRLLRNTHLIVGLLVSLFVLMYALSALQMAHRIKLSPTITEQNVRLPAGMEGRSVALLLMAHHAVDGDLGAIQATKTGFRFSVNRPGSLWNVTYESVSGKTHIHRENRDILGFLNRLHHLNGMSHDTAAMNAWGWALFLVSIALLVLGATGVYMWYRLHSERLIGSMLLAANLTFSLVLIALLRF
jgi:hypothetical protein